MSPDDGRERDVDARRRDRASAERDEAAARRDEAAEQRDRAAEDDPGAGDPAAREAAAREAAAADRRQARRDRRASAEDRREAELDRDASSTERGTAAREHQHASHDGLTGAYVRGAGVLELAGEVERALRAGSRLALAFVDVDDLKALNDAHGHAAGDRMLQQVANALRAELRPYDLIIRYGGDEFVCALPGVSGEQAAERFARARAGLADAPGNGSISIGVAELRPGDSPDDLVARADDALYEGRRRRVQRRSRDGPR